MGLRSERRFAEEHPHPSPLPEGEGPFGVGGESGVILGLLYPPSAVPPGRSAWSVGPIADGVRSYRMSEHGFS
jgi:hypothetical protein